MPKRIYCRTEQEFLSSFILFSSTGPKFPKVFYQISYLSYPDCDIRTQLYLQVILVHLSLRIHVMSYFKIDLQHPLAFAGLRRTIFGVYDF